MFLILFHEATTVPDTAIPTFVTTTSHILLVRILLIFDIDLPWDSTQVCKRGGVGVDLSKKEVTATH